MAVVAAMVLAAAEAVLAQEEYHWIGAGTNGNTASTRSNPSTLWSNSNNWQESVVPSGGKTYAYLWLTNAGTVYGPTLNHYVTSLYVDGTSAAAKFHFDNQTKTFSLSNLHVGSNGVSEVWQSGGYVEVSDHTSMGGNHSSATGTYRLSGGELKTGLYGMTLGYKGKGCFYHTGGTYTFTHEVILGYLGSGQGYYTLSDDGIIDGGAFGVGTHGTGAYTQTGGTAELSRLQLGSCYVDPAGPGSGTANLSGGTLTIGTLWVGTAGGKGTLKVCGSLASITISNALVFGANGALTSSVQVAGLSPIEVAGTAELDGKWTVVDDGAPFGKFDIIHADGGISGTFDAVNLPSEDWSWGFTTGASDTLWVQHVPEPATLGLLAFGVAGLIVKRRRPVV
jgi:hypothetical protein